MAVFNRTTLLVVAVALLYPLVAYRSRVLQLLITNAPHRLVETNVFAHSSVHFAERLRNCEDGLMIEEERVAIFSCDPGRDAWNTVMGTFASDLSTVSHGQLYLYRYGQHADLKEKALTSIDLRGLPDAEAFHPLGIEYDKSSATLFVCNHSQNGSRIEVFSFIPNKDPSKMPVAIHQRTISIPTIKSPNSILALNQNELYVSSDHYFLTKYHPILAWLETYLALPLAGVVYVNLLTDEVRTVAQVPFSNGISLINETTVAVASTSDASVRFFEMSADRSLRQIDKLNLPFMPDNLFTDTKGSLMITGHPHPPTLDKMRKERFKCLEETNIHNPECLHGVAPTSVVERLRDGTLRTLYTTKDQVVGGCTTLRDAEYNLGIVLGLYSKGILVWNM